MGFRAVFLRTPFNYDVDEASLSAGQAAFSVDADGLVLDESRTQQSFRGECDINEIVRRFGITGKLPEDLRVPVSGDFTGIVDFKTALDAVVQAEADFMTLPAETRARFQNDPQQLLSFLDDDKNREEAVRLGLVSAPPVVPRSAVEAIDDLASKLSVPSKA